MKADHSYLADSRLAAKDDLLDNKWDRTMKYDFAGRLTFNQFGMGLGSDNQTMKRVYEQTIGYDKFSNMTTRSGVHWDNDISTGTMTYVNGRLQETSAEFDAAGNAVHTGNISVNPHDFSDTIYDASGRRMGSHTSVKGRWGSILNMVTETKEEMASDGDGRPVIEKRGTRSYHISSPPSGSLTATPYLFQVWSTVLGASLTSVLPNETKSSTSIYAGGTLIAGEGVNGVGWKTADPVTGTLGSYMYYSTFTDASTVENEPLGQQLHPYDPEDPPQPLPNESGHNSADYPQWRCEENNARSLYGEFHERPFECQKRMLQDLSTGLADLYGFSQKKQEDPQGVTDKLIDTPMPKGYSPDLGMTFASNASRKFALLASYKVDGDGECERDGDGRYRVPCQVEKEPEPIEIPDFKDASYGGQDEAVRLTDAQVAKLVADVQLILKHNPNCQSFINEVSAHASSPQNRQFSSNLVEVLKGVHKQEGIWFTKNSDFGGLASGGYDVGRARIDLEPPIQASSPYFTAATKRRNDRSQELKVAGSALSEAFHVAGNANGDFELVTAYAEWKGISLPAFPRPSADDTAGLFKWKTYWSDQWHKRMNQACDFSRVPNR
jgi:hypothetical protein